VYRVYGDLGSGNCYKIKLLLCYLGLEHDWRHVDILAGEARAPEFLARNPIGKVPVLELPGGEYLAESNAILYYLAEGTRYWPSDRLQRAQVLAWQSFEQYSHEPYIAVARFIAKYLGLPEERRAEYESKHERGYRALDIMERHLASRDYFVGGHLTIADISLYAYTHVAHEGGFSLEPYPAIRGWLAAVAGEPGHVTMQGE
jgi:glutathione S-transferase